MRLTEKQRAFVAACDMRYQDGYDKQLRPIYRQMPFFFGPLQWDEWGFWKRSDVDAFVRRILARGLVRTDKEFFYWITDAGRAAIANTPET